MAKKGIDYPPPPPRGEDDEFLSSPDPLDKNRRTFVKIEQGSDEPAVQVETKPGLAWTEPEQSAPAGRERKKPEAPVDAEPLVQVETTKAVKATDEPVGFDSRIEPRLGSASEEIADPLEDISPISDGSQDWRDGWKKKLWDTIKQFPNNVVGDIKTAGKGVAYVATNPLESFRAARTGAERAMEYTKYFMDRNVSLNDKGERLGMDLKALTENYNKLPFRQKAYITAALIGGGAVAATAGLPTLSSIFAGGMYTQRVFGGAGFALNRRKVMESPEHWLANKSNTVKNTYAAVLGGAYLGVSAMAGRYATEKVTEWLGNLFGHGTGVATEVASPPSDAGVASSVASEVPQPAAAAAAVESAVPATAPEVPAEIASVEVQTGRGYEYTMKRLLEKLPVDFDKTKFLEGSDMRRLLDADPKSIDTVLHDIAKENKFFNPDGTSVRIDAGAQMNVGADGDIFLGNTILAPENAPVTPVYHPEAPSAPIVQAPYPDGIVPPDTSPAALEDQGMNPDNIVIPESEPESESEIIPPHTEVPAPAAPEQLQEVNVVSPEPIQTVDVTIPDQGLTGQQTIEAPAVPESVTNQFGLTIPIAEPHIYADPGVEHMFVYGGSPAERAKSILDYLTNNPEKVIFGADDSEKYRIPWYLVEGKAVPGAPVQTNGFFGFFKSFMAAPGPEEFEKLIK